MQGVVSLVDTDGDAGGFQCVPELFRTLEDWRKTQPAGRNGWVPDITGFDIVNVPMQAGDLLIFNSLLAHGIRLNRSQNRVRLAQYISMTPSDESNEALRETGASPPGATASRRRASRSPATRGNGRRRAPSAPR